MNRPYSLTEDEFYKLKRAHDSIQLLQILFDEVQRPTTYTPQMIASFLEGLGEDVSRVIQSVIYESPSQSGQSRGNSHVR